MYTVYRTFREGTGQNVTLQCDRPAELRGKSWDILEEICELTVTPPQPTVTDSTAKTTTVGISQPDQFNTAVRQNVSVQESSPDASKSPPAHLVISLSLFAVSVYMVVVALTLTIRKWRVTCANNSYRPQQVDTAEYYELLPDSSAV
jgi:hypothetical protein